MTGIGSLAPTAAPCTAVTLRNTIERIDNCLNSCLAHLNDIAGPWHSYAKCDPVAEPICIVDEISVGLGRVEEQASRLYNQLENFKESL